MTKNIKIILSIAVVFLLLFFLFQKYNNKWGILHQDLTNKATIPLLCKSGRGHCNNGCFRESPLESMTCTQVACFGFGGATIKPSFTCSEYFIIDNWKYQES